MDKDKLIEAITNEYGVTGDEIMGKSRKLPLMEARQMSMYILREAFNLRIVDIAHLFNVAHSSVIHNINVISNLLTYNEITNNHLYRIKNKHLQEIHPVS